MITLNPTVLNLTPSPINLSFNVLYDILKYIDIHLKLEKVCVFNNVSICFYSCIHQNLRFTSTNCMRWCLILQTYWCKWEEHILYIKNLNIRLTISVKNRNFNSNGIWRFTRLFICNFTKLVITKSEDLESHILFCLWFRNSSSQISEKLSQKKPQ